MQAADIRSVIGVYFLTCNWLCFAALVGLVHPAMWFSHAAFQLFGQVVAHASGGTFFGGHLIADLAQIGTIGAGDAGELGRGASLGDKQLEILEPDLFGFSLHAK